MAKRLTFDISRLTTAPAGTQYCKGAEFAMCDASPLGKTDVNHPDDITASEALGASDRASIASTALTDGELRHKLSIESDTGDAELLRERRDRNSDEVFPTSNPAHKKKVYSSLALQPRSGSEASSLFSDLQESEIDLIRANISQLAGVLESLDEEFEPFCIREHWKPHRDIDIMAAPESSSLLQKRSMIFKDSCLSL